MLRSLIKVARVFLSTKRVIQLVAAAAASTGCSVTSEVCDISAEYCDEERCGNGVVDGGEECDDALDEVCSGCVLPCSAPDLRDPETHHCYRLLQGDPELQWHEANLACDAAGGQGAHLLVVSSEAEYDLVIPWILQVAPDDLYIWLGGIDENDAHEGETWLRTWHGATTFGEGLEPVGPPCVAWYHDETHTQFAGLDCNYPNRHAICELVPAGP